MFFSVLNEEITVAIILRQCGGVVSNFFPFPGLNDRLSFNLFPCAILTGRRKASGLNIVTCRRSLSRTFHRVILFSS